MKLHEQFKQGHIENKGELGILVAAVNEDKTFYVERKRYTLKELNDLIQSNN